MQDDKKQAEPATQPVAPNTPAVATPVNKFIKPDFNNPNNLKGRGFNAPKGMPGGFAPGTFKTQHKG